MGFSTCDQIQLGYKVYCIFGNILLLAWTFKFFWSYALYCCIKIGVIGTVFKFKGSDMFDLYLVLWLKLSNSSYSAFCSVCWSSICPENNQNEVDSYFFQLDEEHTYKNKTNNLHQHINEQVSQFFFVTCTFLQQFGRLTFFFLLAKVSFLTSSVYKYSRIHHDLLEIIGHSSDCIYQETTWPTGYNRRKH